MPEVLPSVSAILLCHNCEAFVGEALRSALAQDYEPMEIVVSDDASEDGTLEVVRRELAAYRGPHSVRTRRRPANSGSKSAHLNDVLPFASGEILVSFDADDVSERRRVTRIVEAFRADPRTRAVFSDFSLIDEAGRALGPGRVPHPPAGGNARAWFARVDAYAAGTTLAVHREVVERFAPLDPEIHEDVVLPFRASLLGEVAFIDEPLVRARRHAASLTADLERFESVERYRARMQQGIDRAARNLASRRADLRAAEALMPGRARELRELEEIAAASVGMARLSGNLTSPSLRTRLAALLRLARAGAYREHLPRHALLALMPRLYLHHKRRSLGAAGRRAAQQR